MFNPKREAFSPYDPDMDDWEDEDFNAYTGQYGEEYYYEYEEEEEDE